jgi:hypothetical protein
MKRSPFRRGGRSIASPVSDRGAAGAVDHPPTQERTMAFISHHLLVRTTAVVPPLAPTPTPTRGSTRGAGVAFAIALAGMVVVLRAHAISEQSGGAFVLMPVVLSRSCGSRGRATGPRTTPRPRPWSGRSACSSDARVATGGHHPAAPRHRRRAVQGHAHGSSRGSARRSQPATAGSYRSGNRPRRHGWRHMSTADHARGPIIK